MPNNNELNKARKFCLEVKELAKNIICHFL